MNGNVFSERQLWNQELADVGTYYYEGHQAKVRDGARQAAVMYAPGNGGYRYVPHDPLCLEIGTRPLTNLATALYHSFALSVNDLKRKSSYTKPLPAKVTEAFKCAHALEDNSIDDGWRQEIGFDLHRLITDGYHAGVVLGVHAHAIHQTLGSRELSPKGFMMRAAHTSLSNLQSLLNTVGDDPHSSNLRYTMIDQDGGIRANYFDSFDRGANPVLGCPMRQLPSQEMCDALSNYYGREVPRLPVIMKLADHISDQLPRIFTPEVVSALSIDSRTDRHDLALLRHNKDEFLALRSEHRILQEGSCPYSHRK